MNEQRVGSDKNRDFLRWIKSVPEKERKNYLQKVVSGGVLSGTSAKAALKKLQQKTMVVLEPLNWTKGMIDYAKHRNDEARPPGTSGSAPGSSEPASDLSVPHPSAAEESRPAASVRRQRACPKSRKRSASREEETDCAKKRRISSVEDTPSIGSETGEADEIIVLPTVKKEKPAEIVNIASPEHSLSTQNNDQNEGIVLRELLRKPNTTTASSQPPSGTAADHGAAPSKPMNNISLVGSNPHVIHRVMTLVPNGNTLPASQRIIEAALKDIANAISDAEIELVKLNDLLASYERLPPAQRSTSNMSALIESHMLLSLKSGLVKQCVDRGIVKQLGRSFYPELLREIHKKERLRIYSSMRLMTMVNMLLTISQSNNDPKQVLSAFVAKAYHEQGQRQEKPHKSNDENSGTVPHQPPKPAQDVSRQPSASNIPTERVQLHAAESNKSGSLPQVQVPQHEIQFEAPRTTAHAGQAPNRTVRRPSQPSVKRRRAEEPPPLIHGSSQVAATTSSLSASSQSPHQSAQSNQIYPPPYPVAVVSRGCAPTSQNTKSSHVINYGAQNSLPTYISSVPSGIPLTSSVQTNISAAPAQNVQVHRSYGNTVQHRQGATALPAVPVSNSSGMRVGLGVGSQPVQQPTSQSHYMQMAAIQTQVQQQQQRPIQQQLPLQLQAQPQQVLLHQAQPQQFVYREQQQLVLLPTQNYQQQHLIQATQPAVVMQSQVLQSQQTVPSQQIMNFSQLSASVQAQGSQFSAQSQASQLNRASHRPSNQHALQYAQLSQQQQFHFSQQTRQHQNQQLNQQYSYQQSQLSSLQSTSNSSMPVHVNQNGGNQQMEFRLAAAEQQPQTDFTSQARTPYDPSRQSVKEVGQVSPVARTASRDSGISTPEPAQREFFDERSTWSRRSS